MVLMGVTLLVQLPLAVLLGVFLNTELRGYRLFRVAYFIPCVISTVVIGIVWSLIYDPYAGLFNQLLTWMHLHSWTRNWLGDPNIALNSVSFVNIWQWYGYLLVIVMAGLKIIPGDIIEASRMDGANAFQKFIYITIPSIKWTLQVCVILIITGVLKIFDLVYVMTGGGPIHSTEVMTTFMWRISFVSANFGAGNAAAVVVLAISFVLTLISLKLARE